MTSICAHCGTEVEGEALFCPTCGQPLASGGEPELPPAPDWPELPSRPRAQTPADAEETDRGGSEADAEPEGRAGTPPGPPPAAQPPEPPELAGPPGPAASPPPTMAMPTEAPVDDPASPPATHGWERPMSEQPVPPWRRGAAFRSGEEGSSDAAAQSETPGALPPSGGPDMGSGAGSAPGIPGGVAPGPSGRPESPVPDVVGVIRLPTLLSDWCAGIGALLALVAMFLPWRVAGSYTSGWGLASGMNVLYTIVVLAVLAVVFLTDLLPRIPERALVLLSVGLVGVGIGLDRLGQPLTGAGGVLFLIGALGIAVGGVIAQLGHDRPVGGPQA
jgi:zinc-ribbon domain